MAGWVGAMVASTVFNGIVQGSILTVLVWLVLRTMPKLSASTRHSVWTLTLLFVAILPFLQALLQAAAEGSVPIETTAGAPLLAITGGWWAPALLAIWAAGALLLLSRVAWSYALLQRLKRKAFPLPSNYQAVFDEIQASGHGRRQAVLLASDELAVPVAAGLRAPAVLVPSFMVDHLSEAEFRDVLIHELAHLRRADDWTNLVQRVIEAVLFFHPAVLWIARRLTLEREIACDDWVVAMTGTPRPYAACLTKLAALVPSARPQLAPGAVARKPQVSLRVEALLAKRHHGRPTSSKAVLALASVALTVAAAAAPAIAPLGAVEPPAPVVSSRIAHAPVPQMAYARPRPAMAPKIASAPVHMARARRPAIRPLPAPFEQVSYHADDASAVRVYVVYMVFWWHAPPDPAAFNHI